jgi:hypothetical protein
MMGELLAVVMGERVDKVGMRLECCEQSLGGDLSWLVGRRGGITKEKHSGVRIAPFGIQTSAYWKFKSPRLSSGGEENRFVLIDKRT